MTAPDPRTIVRHHLVQPVATLAEIESRHHTISRYQRMQGLAFPEPPLPRTGLRLPLLLSAAFWLALGLGVWAYWLTDDPATVTPRTVATVVPR